MAVTFIDNLTKLPPIPPLRMVAIMERFVQFGETYSDAIQALAEDGVTLEDWRPLVELAQHDKIRDNYGPGWEELHLGDFSLALRDRFANHDVGHDSREQFFSLGIESDQYDFRGWTEWVPDLWDAQTGLGKFYVGMCLWIINGMYQVQVAQMLNNCFGNGHRGRPKGH